MARSRKGGRLARRKSALALLEARYKKFKAAHEDKAPRITAKNSKHPKERPGRSYKAECLRLETEIENLKAKISKNVN